MKPGRESIGIVSLYFLVKFVVLLFFVIFVIYAGSLFSGYPYNKPQSLNDFADSLSGLFAPLAFAGVCIGLYFQRKGMESQILNSKFSSLTPFFIDEMKRSFPVVQKISSRNKKIVEDVLRSAREMGDEMLLKAERAFENCDNENWEIDGKSALDFLNGCIPYKIGINFNKIAPQLDDVEFFCVNYDAIFKLYQQLADGDELVHAFKLSQYANLRADYDYIYNNLSLIRRYNEIHESIIQKNIEL